MEDTVHGGKNHPQFFLNKKIREMKKIGETL
jgi:hypothetical protein